MPRILLGVPITPTWRGSRIRVLTPLITISCRPTWRVRFRLTRETLVRRVTTFRPPPMVRRPFRRRRIVKTLVLIARLRTMNGFGAWRCVLRRWTIGLWKRKQIKRFISMKLGIIGLPLRGKVGKKEREVVRFPRKGWDTPLLTYWILVGMGTRSCRVGVALARFGILGRRELSWGTCRPPGTTIVFTWDVRRIGSGKYYRTMHSRIRV